MSYPPSGHGKVGEEVEGVTLSAWIQMETVCPRCFWWGGDLSEVQLGKALGARSGDNNKNNSHLPRLLTFVRALPLLLSVLPLQYPREMGIIIPI